MPRNEEGEFELVVGNRQLLSGFFIVVVLFGVFFTMGYIVGRHSSPPPLNSTSAAVPETAPTQPPTSAAPAPGRAAVVEADAIKAETPKAETPPPENPRSTTRPATAPAESPRPAAPHAVTSEMPGPPPGRYWQVAAPRRTAADAVVESLRNKGITAVIAPGPNEDTVRVLVGPVDPANVGKVRTDLESAGFRPFLKNY